jgi:hypothetical protein
MRAEITIPTLRAFRDLETYLDVDDVWVLYAALTSLFGRRSLPEHIAERLTSEAIQELHAYPRARMFLDPSKNGLWVYLTPMGMPTFFPQSAVLKSIDYGIGVGHIIPTN